MWSVTQPRHSFHRPGGDERRRTASRVPRLRWRVLALGVAVSVAGCQKPQDASPEVSQSSAAVLDADLTLGCSDRRWVGANTDNTPCPAPSDDKWNVSRLFGSMMPAELAAYCVYEWSSETIEPNVDGLPSVDWLDRDCEVVAAYGHPFATHNGPQLEDAFEVQVDALLTLPPTPNPVTRVVVVDSATEGGFPNGGKGLYEHGQAMSTIIRNLACPPGPGCAAEVATSLAAALGRDARRLATQLYDRRIHRKRIPGRGCHRKKR